MLSGERPRGRFSVIHEEVPWVNPPAFGRVAFDRGEKRARDFIAVRLVILRTTIHHFDALQGGFKKRGGDSLSLHFAARERIHGDKLSPPLSAEFLESALDALPVDEIEIDVAGGDMENSQILLP